MATDRITIVIECGNSAFEGPELQRILRELATKLDANEWAYTDAIGEVLMDSNGNRVGRIFGDVGAPSVA